MVITFIFKLLVWWRWTTGTKEWNKLEGRRRTLRTEKLLVRRIRNNQSIFEDYKYEKRWVAYCLLPPREIIPTILEFTVVMLAKVENVSMTVSLFSFGCDMPCGGGGDIIYKIFCLHQLLCSTMARNNMMWYRTMGNANTEFTHLVFM